MAAARSASGKLVLILQDDSTKKLYAGTTKGLTPLAARCREGRAAARSHRRRATRSSTGSSCSTLDQQLQSFIVPVGSAGGIRPQSTTTAVELEPTLRYDAKRGVFVQTE